MKHKQRLHKLPETSAFKNCDTLVNRRSIRQIGFCLSYRGRHCDVGKYRIVLQRIDSISYRDETRLNSDTEIYCVCSFKPSGGICHGAAHAVWLTGDVQVSLEQKHQQNIKLL